MKGVVDGKQKFEIGRTINPMLCNCEKCDFLHCANYAVRMKSVDYTVEEFVEQNKDALIASHYLIGTDDLAYAFFGAFGFGLGKGFYWESRMTWDKEIQVVKFVNKESATCYHVSLENIDYGNITEGSKYFVSEGALSCARRIAKKLKQIKEFAEK